MDYHEFRDLWLEVLRAARLPVPYPLRPKEQINLRNMDRSFEMALFSGLHPKCEPFHVAIIIQWNWDSVLSARYETTEEDMLMQLFGDFDVHEDTVLPILRMDISLMGSLPYAAIFPFPKLSQWQSWVQHTRDQLQTVLPTRFDEEGHIRSYCDELLAKVTTLDNGQLNLQQVTFEAWQVIALPRHWDDPEKHDPAPQAELMDLAKRISQAWTSFEDCLAQLRPAE